MSKYEPARKPENDFNWFASGELDTSGFRGKYIAVYERQVIGWGETSVEAYNMAKASNPESEPALTYIPESEDIIF